MDSVTIASSVKTVSVPVRIGAVPGIAGFTMQFELPQGFTLNKYTWGNAYANAYNEVEWNSDTLLLNWTSAAGKNVNANPGAVVMTLVLNVPAELEEGEACYSYYDG